jgi:cytidine deaminase
MMTQESLGTSEKQKLMDAAREAATRAYAPYSNFRVGSAVLLTDGRIFAGCNVENASYGLTICAERTAAFKAVSEGGKRIVAVAVTVDPETSGSSFPPCGACRQVLAEFMEPQGLVIIDGIGEFPLSELLPLASFPETAKRIGR